MRIKIVVASTVRQKCASSARPHELACVTYKW